MWSLLISKILQTICLFGTTYWRINLIRPAAISEEMIVPLSPFGNSTKVMVFVTFLTLHSTKSPSFMDFFLFGKKKFLVSRKIYF